MEDKEIYYKKKANAKRVISTIILILLMIAVIYLLFFFVLNPTKVIAKINQGEMSPAYSRDYIFSVIPDIINSDIEPLEIVINSDLNTMMSESFESISLNSADNIFDWERFFKFGTSVIKTPYDTRYIKFDNFQSSYYYNYDTAESHLASILVKYLAPNANTFIDSNDYDVKKLKIYKDGASVADKFKFHYEKTFDQQTSQQIFDELLSNIWDSKYMLAFFQSDNDIQEKLKIQNNTKDLIELIYNIKNMSSVQSLKVGLIANKDFVESIAFEFSINYKIDGKTYNIKIDISEYLKSFDDSRSPEDTFDPISVTNFNDLGPYKEYETETPADKKQFEGEEIYETSYGTPEITPESDENNTNPGEEENPLSETPQEPELNQETPAQ